MCSQGINDDTATLLCRSVLGTNAYGALGFFGSSIEDFVFPLTPTSLSNVTCSTDEFDSSSCTYTTSDCSNLGGEAVISCATGRYCVVVD